MTADELKRRTKQFAIDVALLCDKLPNRPAFRAYTYQLLKASGSVGANYRAACRAKSYADFVNKLKIVEEEIDESAYFMELIHELDERNSEAIKKLMKEADELTRIAAASINTARGNKN